MSNSSGSVERFLLGPSEAKLFEVLSPGGTRLVVDAANPLNQGVDGLLSSGGNGDATVLIESGDDVVALKSRLTTALVGANNDLTFIAVASGVAGDSITIEYVDPVANGAALGVVVAGTDITVNLATDGGGLITSTAGDILTAIQGSAPASALATVALAAGNDGLGVVTALAQTPLAGGADAVAGTANFTTATTLTVARGGQTSGAGNVGRYGRIRNTGLGVVSVVVKPLHRLQPLTTL